MSNNKKPTKAEVLAGVQGLIAGTQKHFPTGSLTVGNVAYAPSVLIALFQSVIDAMNKQTAAQVSEKDATAELRVVVNQVRPVIKAYREMLGGMFGESSQVLSDFGLSPRKVPAPLTTEQLAAKKARAEATRKARGTKGPKAKLAIKGDVTVEAAPPPAPVPAPAKPAG